MNSNSTTQKRLLGEVLLAKGQIRKYQLEFILQVQSGLRFLREDLPLGLLLIKHRVITEATLNEALNVQSEMPFESVTKILAAYENQVSKLTRYLPAEVGL